MKHLIVFFFTAITLLVTHSSLAQVVNIPDKAKQSFADKYPKAKDIVWTNNISNYTATFRRKKTHYTAHYNIDGAWDNTENQLDNDDVPKDVREAFSKNRFADWKVNSTDFVEDSKGQNLYRYNLKKGIEKKYLYFDKTGKEVKVNSGI